MRVAIVGTGSSLNPYLPLIFPRGVHVIVVNGGHVLAPGYDEWFTLDLSYDNQCRLRSVRNPVVAFDNATIPAYLRGPNVRTLKRIAGDEFGRFRVKFGMSDKPDEIHTGNSVTGAMQYAVHSGARKIAVFGMDGGRDYANGVAGRPLNLDMLPAICDNLKPALDARGVQVLNASPGSYVTAFERCKVPLAMDWIQE